MAEYTLAQVAAFGGAIDRARKRQERTLAILVRASQYDTEQFTEFLKG